MNDDAVKVRQIDLPSIFPTLQIFEAFTLALHPVSVAASILVVGSLLSVESVCGRPSTDSPNDALLRLLTDLHVLSVRGFGAGLLLWMGVALRLGLLSFAGVVIGRSVVNRMCSQQLAGPPRSSAPPALIPAGLTAWGLACLLLSVSFVGLRFGQWLTNLFAGSDGAGLISSLPAVFSGTLFLVASALILTAWVMSTTSLLAERSDGSEALSRCLSYGLSRPVRTVCLMSLSFAISQLFGALSTFLFASAASLQNLRPLASATRIDADAASQIAAFFSQVLSLSSFMTATSIAYLLVRLAEDGIPVHQRK